MSQVKKTTSEAFARMVVDEASEKMGADIVLLDLRGVSDFTDFFVIVSGETERHLDSLCENVARRLRKSGLRAIGREGTGSGGWILLDFSGVTVHFFTRSVRKRYALERLWRRAAEIVRVQ